MSENKITSINCTPVRPSFAGVDRQKLEETTELLRGINVDKIKRGNLDEDTVDRIKDYVKNIDVNPDSKVQGPLKTFVLSLLTLGTGMLVTKGTAGKLFYQFQKKAWSKPIFDKLGVNLQKVTTKLSEKAALNETAGAARKYFFKALNHIAQKANKFAEKGLDVAKDTPEFLSAKAKKLTESAVDFIGAATGLTTTGLALSVDKDNNGRSDILEARTTEDKKTQKAVLDFATTVLDAV